ncbi:PAK-box/P21-Rho-binding protein [Corchorus olitorius]|uniref:PAK-box/P21-Rho-binding protein n=1 Tax=Corchorus olitorius TaxID=93759 RepID=A0A1R3KVR9_9ROSI|nr:PAK-box/P21-Rho-binding protein [Corchorus olitorius]
MASNNNKMKGLLKGLRYISQIFDNEKEPEMQIGLPTDVKHVAHIGWDGPSMNEFKSAPLANGDQMQEEDVKWVSEDSNHRKGSRGQNSDTPEVPKASRRSSSANGNGEKEKSDKPRQSRKGSTKSSSSDNSGKSKKAKDPNQATDSASTVHSHDNPPTIPKKSRRKKSKDSSAHGGSTSSRRSRTEDMDNGSESGSVSRPREERVSNASNYEE